MGRSTDYVYFVRGQEHANLFLQSAASVGKADPQARIYVYQEPDIGLEIPAHQGFTHCHVPPGLPLQLAKTSAQCRHVMTAEPLRDVIFLDTDTLVLKPIGEAFHPAADMLVTWRRTVHKPGEEAPTDGVASFMPYNAGVWGVRSGLKGVEIMLWLRERVRLRQGSGEVNSWFADQTALAELAGAPPTTEAPLLTMVEIPWLYHSHGETVMILKLPCSTWNYSPPTSGEDLDGKGILHFKGQHRKFMETYAERLGLRQFASFEEEAVG